MRPFWGVVPLVVSVIGLFSVAAHAGPGDAIVKWDEGERRFEIRPPNNYLPPGLVRDHEETMLVCTAPVRGSEVPAVIEFPRWANGDGHCFAYVHVSHPDAKLGVADAFWSAFSREPLECSLSLTLEVPAESTPDTGIPYATLVWFRSGGELKVDTVSQPSCSEK